MANQTMAVIKNIYLCYNPNFWSKQYIFFFFKYTDSKLDPFSYGYIVCMYHVLNLIHTFYQLAYLGYSQIKVFEEKPQKVDTKSNYLMPTPLLKTDF